MPKSGSYEYAVVVGADENKMSTFTQVMQSNQKPYKVLQQDEKAHIVASQSLSTTSYIIFDEHTELKEGVVVNVSRPASFVIEKTNEGMRVAVADPDLNIYDGQDDRLPDGSRVELSIYEREWYFWPSRATKVRIKLRGEWAITKQLKSIETVNQKHAKIIKVNASETIIEFECKDGLTAEVLLSPKQ